MERKIIQIVNVDEILFCVCDDGTAWFLRSGKWIKLPTPKSKDDLGRLGRRLQ